MSWYRTGTVVVTNGSKTVMGVGTLWTTAVNTGDAFALVDANLNPTGAWYEVESVVSNTEITLKQSYAGSTGSNKQYCVFNLVGNMTTPSFAQRLATFFASFQILIDKPTTTPTASSIPIADSSGKIADGWIPATVARLASPTLASPTLTGTPTAPTAPSGTSTVQIATTEFVKTAVDVGIASNDAMALRGTLGTGGTAASLPTNDYLVGWTYKVVSSGTYAGQACSIGDLMICVSSFNTAYKDADWSRVPISDEYSDYYLLEGDPA
jgi:hypothetical protein